jgi:thioredoxin reductase (NADPH)
MVGVAIVAIVLEHSHAMNHTTDIVIVGAGPVGLFAVFEAGMLKMRCHVVDALDMVGGQCAALYPEKPIYDIPGYPRIEGQSLVDKLAEQAAPFAPVYHLGQQVTTVAPGDDGGWRVGTSKGVTIHTRAIIVAAGSGAFGPNRPPLEGLADYEGGRDGCGVFYMVGRREDFRNQRVVIAGGGDSAVDWAVSLAEVAKSVAVVHRRPRFRAAPDTVERMHKLAEDGAIDLVIPYQLDRLEGDDGHLAAVGVRDLEGAELRLDADALLCFFGLAMELGPIAHWGLALAQKHIVVDPATAATNSPGIFAIGDITAYPGKLKLILTGFSEAAMAAHAIHPLVFPDEALHFEYSTNTGITGF